MDDMDDLLLGRDAEPLLLVIDCILQSIILFYL
jgi:hypothetical protein